MTQPARLAVGTIQPDADPRPMLWALVDVLRREGVQVQAFLSEANFAGYRETAAATGLHPRHLDSWLMSPEMCRDVFDRGSRAADMAIVHGRFAAGGGLADREGSRLEPLCQWLELPRVAIVDGTQVGRCRVPPRPDQTDWLLLDRVQDLPAFNAAATNLEALWGIPVLGGLPELPQVRAALAGEAGGCACSRDLCRELGARFFHRAGGESIRAFALRRETGAATPRHGRRPSGGNSVTVAVAYDEAFHCYFPDVLEQLESRGAAVVDFSPLRDEAIPDGAKVVYLGCGCPESFAGALAENHCMKVALRNHLRRGGRIYGEGGGLAYLCHRMETPDGRFEPMVGIIPATAGLVRHPGSPQAVEVALTRPNWLGPIGQRLRGYRNPKWWLRPTGALVGFAAESECPDDLVGSYHAVGSLLHLHFAAMPDLLGRFFMPSPCCCSVPDPWTAVQ